MPFLKKTFSLLLLVLLATTIRAESGFVWEPVGPSGGDFLYVAADPDHPSSLTAITRQPPGVFKSGDSGRNWRRIASFDSDRLADLEAADSGNLFATDFTRCFRSTDGGATWKTSSYPESGGYVNRLLVDPGDAKHLLGLGFGRAQKKMSLRLFRSSDGGETWSFASGPELDRADITDFVRSPADPQRLLAIGVKREKDVYSGLLLFSPDAGTTWQDISASVSREEGTFFNWVAFDPADADHICVGGDSFYLSSNGGATWTRSGVGLVSSAGAFDPSDSRRIIAVGQREGFLSEDSGRTWSRLGGIRGQGASLATSAGKDSGFLLATSSGLYRSPDGGETWIGMSHGFSATDIRAVALSPAEPEALFIAAAGAGVMKTIDGGANWIDLAAFTGCEKVGHLVVSYKEPDVLLALEGDG
ncbi:hypothetical protein HQ520_14865 [bacterium]|nr:hypothetical protein [bacterium]